MISIVTGTLDRVNLLPKLIDNTINNDDRIELILCDGGSTDGTIEYIKSLNNDRIKLIEIGGRSTYPHFMNLGIKNATHDYVCQWNDDVILVNNWSEVIDQLTSDYDFYIFNWKYGNENSINDQSWLNGVTNKEGWSLTDYTNDNHNHLNNDEIVMNFGIYNKNVFKKIGLFNNDYLFYCADGDMSYRAHKFGFKHKSLSNIKVCSIITPKKAVINHNDILLYNKNRALYAENKLPDNLEYLS